MTASSATPEKPCGERGSEGKAEDVVEASVEQLKEEVEVLRKALNEERERAEKRLTQMKYLQADIDNFKKRLKREVDLLIESNQERLITSLLSVIDELELAVKAGRESRGKKAIVRGVEMVLKKLYETLGKEGLTPIEAVGKTFDPHKHQAVATVPAEGGEEGTILREVRKGFMFKSRVLRPSIVEVASAPPTSQDEETGKGV
ncbi:MAG: nucleotide exchange factor GrpE [Candidatus Bathyarchaeia archaeon]